MKWRLWIGFLIFLPSFVLWSANTISTTLNRTSGIAIVFSDGTSVNISTTQIFNFFQNDAGTVAQRKADTIVWIATTAAASAGPGMLRQSDFSVDIDTQLKQIIKLELQ